MEVFLNPSHHAEQMPWVREARRRVSRDLRRRVEELRFFLEPSVETFAFLWLESPQQTLESELHALCFDEARYVDAVVKRLSGAALFRPDDMERIRRPSSYRKAAAEYLRSHSGPSEAVTGFLESPTRSLHSFCAVMVAFYEQAIAQKWGSISQRLLEDITMRRRILRDKGVAAVLRTLSPALSIRGASDGLTVDFSAGGATLKLTGSNSLLLTPSFFCWPHTQTLFLKAPEKPHCVMTYPLPPLPATARRLNSQQDLGMMLEALANPVRLRIAELLRERDLSTRELAGFLRISEPVVSRHLHGLLRCGLLSQERSGYFVMYRLRRAAMKQLAHGLSALS